VVIQPPFMTGRPAPQLLPLLLPYCGRLSYITPLSSYESNSGPEKSVSPVMSSAYTSSYVALPAAAMSLLPILRILLRLLPLLLTLPPAAALLLNSFAAALAPEAAAAGGSGRSVTSCRLFHCLQVRH
jgi:hypothetical protein